MPAISPLSVEEIVTALCAVNIFKDEIGSIKTRGDKVRKEVCADLDNKISPETLNLYVRINRNNILLEVKKRCAIIEVPNEINNTTLDSSKNNSSVTDPDYVVVAEKKKGPLPTLYVAVDLDYETWKTIAPIEKTYKERTGLRSYECLQEPWTDILSKHLYEKTKIPCAYSFKRAKISNGGVWLRINGKCNECNSDFEGHCLNEPKLGTGISIAVTVADTRGIPHYGKRQLTGSARFHVGRELLTKKASAWRKEAIQSMEFGDPEPSHVPNAATLRKLREEVNNHDLGVQEGLNMIDSLYQMKYSGEFAGYISEIGLDGFYCIYSSPMQIALYKEQIKKIKKVAIDATGGVVKSVKKPNGESRYIYLYQVVMSGEKELTPIFQMLSGKHDTASIGYWLNVFLKLADRIPPEAVCDFSLALLNAVNLSFNGCRLKVYITDCFRWANGEMISHVPQCYVRLDVAHFIKLICRKKVFEGKPGRVKDFYVRSIGVMTTCEEITEFKKLFSAILVVALSECDGNDEVGNNIISQEREMYLFERIRTFTYAGEEYEHHEEEEERPIAVEEPSDVGDEVKKFVEPIRLDAEDDAKLCRNFDRPNPYYLPGLVDPLLKLALFFPLWTNIMKDKFNSTNDVGTSAIVEAYFKNLKNNDLANFNGPIRADKFFVKHMRSIEASCKYEKAAVKRANAEPQQNIVKKLRSQKEDETSTAEEKLLKKELLTTFDGKWTLNSTVLEKTELDSTDFNCDLVSSLEENALDNTDPEGNEHLFEEENWKGQNESKKTIVHEKMLRGPLKEEKKTNPEITRKRQSSGIKEDIHRIPLKVIENSNHNTNTIQNMHPEIPKQKSRGKYLTACSEIEIIHNRPLRRQKNAILRNGICLGPIKMGNRLVQLKNTCPLDTVVEILTTAYIDNEDYKNYVDSFSENDLTLSLLRNYAKNGPSKNVYAERGCILDRLYKEQNNVIDCAANITSLIGRLFIDMPSVTKTTNCTKCNATTTTEISIDVDPQEILTKGFSKGFPRFLEGYFTDKTTTCTTCEDQCKIDIQPGNNVIFDLEFALTKLFHIQFHPEAKDFITLAEVPKTVILKGKKYILNGIAVFKEAPAGNTIGHYLAYCRRVTNSWEIHDDLCKELQKLQHWENKKVKASTIIYTRVA